jgi:D-serine deaminase-like pyridoxal phosphate-dependent protein
MFVAMLCCCRVLPGARVSIVVDALQPLQLVADTAAAWGASIDVLVEINAGQDRCAQRSSTPGGKLCWHALGLDA